MLDLKKDIQSLTSFRRNSAEVLKQIKKTKRPVVLTVKGKATAIIQDADSYQRLLDIAAGADVFDAIRQSIEESKKGQGRPAREFFEEFEAANGIRD